GPPLDRGGALRAPGDRRAAGDRRPEREPRRGGEGGGRLARREAHRRRRDRLLQGAPRRVQVSAHRRVRGGLAQGSDRQDPQARARRLNAAQAGHASPVLGWLVRQATSRPRAVIGAWLVLVALAGAGGAQLEFAPTTESILSQEGEPWRFYRESVASY